MSKWLRRTWVGTMALTAIVGAWSGSESAAWAKAERHDCAERPRPGKHRDDGTWRVLNTSGRVPSGRSAPAVGASGRWVYLFGGTRDNVVNGEVTLLDDLHRFDTQTNRWQSVTVSGARPSARAFTSLVNDPDSGALIMYGGATFGDFYGDFEALSDLWIFDPELRVWTQTSGDDGPGPRSGASTWMHDGKFYLFGGLDSFFQTHSDVWSYDFSSASWQEVIVDGAATSPPPRHEAISGIAHGKLTLYGGETVTEDFNFVTLPDTWQYDLSTQTWRELTPSPQYDIDPPRNLGAAALVDGALYFHGGDVPGGVECGAVFAQNPTDELWRFDVRRERWELLSPRGHAVVRLKRSRGVAVNGAMYIFAGYDFVCGATTGAQVWNRDVFRYQPARRK